LVLIDDVEKKLSRGLSTVGRNPYAADLYTVLDYIDKNSPVARGTVLSRFWHDLQPDELAKVLEVLKACGEITERSDGVLTKL